MVQRVGRGHAQGGCGKKSRSAVSILFAALLAGGETGGGLTFFKKGNLVRLVETDREKW